MQDRLAELKGGKNADYSEEGGEGGGDFMSGFFGTVEEVKANLERIEGHLATLEEKYSQALGLVSSDESNKVSQEIDGLSSQVTQAATATKKKLEKMKTEIDASDKPSEKRMRETMHGTLSRKFFDLMKRYQELQARYRGKWREKVERQIKIAAPNTSPEEIDEIIDSGDPNKIFADKIMASQDASVALAYVQERHDDIQKLEKSIMELHQLFVDMQILVESQGELLDQIEFSINQSEAYIEDAEQIMGESLVYANSARKKICIIIVLCIICIIVITVPIVVTLKN